MTVTSLSESKGADKRAVSLETVQPAGIMHYGAAFTQRYMLMGGGGPNDADDEGFGRMGEERVRQRAPWHLIFQVW